MKRRSANLVLPTALAVTQLVLAGCTTNESTDSAVNIDASCNPVVQSDGAVQCQGGGYDLFCLGPLSPCTVTNGDASPQCCQLVG